MYKNQKPRTENQKPKLRPARRLYADGRHFARYLNAASGDLMRLLFGRHMERILAEAYLSPAHDMSFEHVVFAELDGQVAGMAASYSGKDHQGASMEPIAKAAGLSGIRPALLAAIGYRVISFAEALPEDDYYVLALAVSPDLRGHGIGSVLLEDVERRAQEAGCKRLALDVDIRNTKAQRLYERIGMSVERQSPSIPFLRGSGIYRMVKPL